MAKYDPKKREEELKLCIAEDWFAAYDCKRRIGNIDFCVELKATPLGIYGADGMLWAEAKAGTNRDILESFVQLILTIGRSRIAEEEHPPRFLGAFDAEKIAFLPYDSILDVLAQNDFNWNVTPSNHETKEFKQLYELAKNAIGGQPLLFNYENDETELRKFIKENFVAGRRGISHIKITRNNFTHIYQKWRREVMPSLAVENWDALRKEGIIDADFFLADILSDKDNRTIRKKLFVLLQSDVYEVKYGKASNGLDLVSKVGFSDGQTAHKQFWNRYVRPPRKDYWDYIVERRDLLVDQDVRERKGAFFTPQKWVELSQDYLAKELGENWQDEYVIWDCCAGTGNMEAGLTNKYNVWASTIDKADVDVMHTRIKMMNERANDAANLLDEHVFQFDFLNDSFDKLPKGLKAIIDDPEKRKKLVIYINPPYAEAGTKKTMTGGGQAKTGVSFNTYVYSKYAKEITPACRELFAQFIYRIHKEINGAVIGQFSKLKIVQAQNFSTFRKKFGATLGRSFIVPANTFDNVKGKFPIGFFIWHTDKGVPFEETTTDVYDSSAHFIGTKVISSCAHDVNVIEWLRRYYDKRGEHIGYLRMNGTNVQSNPGIYLTGQLSPNDKHNHFYADITKQNVLEMSVYNAIRQSVDATWMNDRDQYIVPKEVWASDNVFIGNCLIYSLFHTQNRISSEHGTNHWIPFTEEDVDAQDCFESHFMSDLLAGKYETVDEDLFGGAKGAAFAVSPEARAVLDAGLELWRYYHAQPKANPNASYYDIRKHFQGMKVTEKGKEEMNSKSDDAKYNELHAALKNAMKKLADKIEPKVYEYGFLKR